MADGQDRLTANWIERRTSSWQDTEASLEALEDRKPVSTDQALTAMRQYPELARDLALARRAAPNSTLTRHLQRLYSRLHRVIFRKPSSLRRVLIRTFSRDAAQAADRIRLHIASVTFGFVLAGFAGWWLVSTYPELATLFASEEMIEKVQGGELWTDNLLNIMPSALLSVSIFTNNIVVTLTAVSLGVLYGLGTLYIMGLNGLMLGGIFAFTAQHGLAGRLFEFVTAHGFVELSVIAIGGAIGFYIGECIARPGHQGRIESFRRAVSEMSPLIVVCVVFLVGAGLIEGYISPDDRFPLSMRLSIGLAYWLLLALVLTGPLFRRGDFPSAADNA